MGDFTVTCPLVPSVPHLVSGFCSSPRAFALDFLPTPPRGDAVALPLPFGFSYTWREDFHLASYVPCPAHTSCLTILGKSREARLFKVCVQASCWGSYVLNSSYHTVDVFSSNQRCQK